MVRGTFRHLIDTLGPATTFVLLSTAAAIAGLALMPAEDRSDNAFWTFAATHAEAAESAASDYQSHTGRTLGVTDVPSQALDLRLTTLLDEPASALPEVVQLDAAAATRLLDRPGRLPFLRLDDRPELQEIIDNTLPRRLDLWRRDGVLVGLSIDVHPVALAYRVDLWTQAGLDPSTARTWSDLAALATTYTAHHGRPAFELSDASSEHTTLLLQQAGLDAVDDLATDKTADLVLFQSKLLADDVAVPSVRGHSRWAADFAAGNVGMLWMPDWRVAYLRRAAPALAGTVALMPLPAWTSNGPTTAGWGGTMLAVPANVKHPGQAVELLAFLVGDKAVRQARLDGTDILPAAIDFTPASGKDDFFTTGPPRRLYASLAPQVQLPPPDADFLAAAGHLSVALSGTVADFRRGLDEAEIRRRLLDRLADAAADVRRRQRRPRRGCRRR